MKQKKNNIFYNWIIEHLFVIDIKYMLLPFMHRCFGLKYIK